tara:strand:+ start:5890 stop:6006 length:117 start_codon:yes stop_codon:yes gene_type:complete
MEFNWRGAIDRNCELLCDIAFRLNGRMDLGAINCLDWF